MIRLIIILFIGTCVVQAANDERIKIDATVLAEVPQKRHAALTCFAITTDDGTPAIDEKKAKYAEALKAILKDLLKTYYWHSDFPLEVDEAIQKRALFLAGLHYPASPTTGCSYYEALVQDYTIGMYEEQIVLTAQSVCERLKEKDVQVVNGKTQRFDTWKKVWDKAGAAGGGLNTPLTVCPTRLISFQNFNP